jgi:hypothetical protein
VGFVYHAAGRVTLDPDQRVQETIRAFFETFRRTGSATATVKAFRAISTDILHFAARVLIDSGSNGPLTGGRLIAEGSAQRPAASGHRFSRLRLQTHRPEGTVVGTAVSTPWSRGRVD